MSAYRGNTGDLRGFATIKSELRASMAAFDRLPRRMRDRLNEALVNFDPGEAEQLVKDHGVAATLALFDRAETNIARALCR